MLARKQAQTSLQRFIEYRQAGYQPALHHRLLIDHLEAVERGEIERLMVCMPPGSAKSTYTSIEFPAWFLGRNPALAIIAASHTDELAERFGRRVRNIVGSPAFRNAFGFSIASDSHAAGRWDTERGGEYFAAGVGGSITGRRADLGLIDDPVKGREDADSDRSRERAWEWYVNDFLTRLKPGARQIVVMCMVGNTRVLMADGTEKALKHIRAGDEVATCKDGALSSSVIRNWANQGPDSVYEIRMKSGTTVKANERHPFLVARDGGTEWIRLRNLKIGDKILCARASGESGEELSALAKDATSQQSARASACLTTTNLDGQADIGRRRSILSRGAKPECDIGMESLLPSIKSGSLRKTGDARSAGSHQRQTCDPIGAASSASITSTARDESADCSATTAISRSATQRPQTHCSEPLSTYAIVPDCVVAITAAGREDVFDVQVDDTENFIANGLVSHNTRWHEDDLGGRILERERARWTVVELPMEAMARDPLGRKPGERLWPEWFTDEMVATAKQDVRAWNALYQQQPASDEGDYFKRDWFGEYDERPQQLSVYGASDFAVTEGGGDYTEHGVFGLDGNGNLYVLDWWRGQEAADAWIERFCDAVIQHEPLCWFGESGPIRKAIEPFLMRRMSERNAHCRIEWLPSIADKPTRARAFQARTSMGKVWFPKLAVWKADVLGQLLRFPAGKHDDSVDVCSLIGRGLQHMGTPKRATFALGDPPASWMSR